ncbi:MAG: OmpA family protein [Caulobacteraceae bacterium]
MRLLESTAGRRVGGLSLAFMFALALAGGCQSPRPPAVARGSVIRAPARCGDFTVAIYFESQSAAVTPQAAQLLAAAAQRARGCDVTGINVVGLADAVGAPSANLALSRARANAVTLALHRRGLTTVAFQVAAAGAAGAETREGRARLLRRRADVQFHLAPRPPAAPRSRRSRAQG